jgi:hypothetical protein
VALGAPAVCSVLGRAMRDLRMIAKFIQGRD